MPMEDINKPTADVSDLGALEKEEPKDNVDEYERHSSTPTKEVVGIYVCIRLLVRYLH